MTRSPVDDWREDIELGRRLVREGRATPERVAAALRAMSESSGTISAARPRLADLLAGKSSDVAAGPIQNASVTISPPYSSPPARAPRSRAAAQDRTVTQVQASPPAPDASATLPEVPNAEAAAVTAPSSESVNTMHVTSSALTHVPEPAPADDSNKTDRLCPSPASLQPEAQAPEEEIAPAVLEMRLKEWHEINKDGPKVIIGGVVFALVLGGALSASIQSQSEVKAGFFDYLARGVGFLLLVGVVCLLVHTVRHNRSRRAELKALIPPAALAQFNQLVRSAERDRARKAGFVNIAIGVGLLFLGQVSGLFFIFAPLLILGGILQIVLGRR